MRTAFFYLALAILLLLPAAQAADPATPPYTVQFRGEFPESLRRQMAAVTTTVELQQRPPPALALLQRRVEADVDTINSLLRSLGFYNPSVAATVDSSTEPLAVVFRVQPGPLYRLDNIQVNVPDDTDLELLASAMPAIKPGAPGRAAAILAAQDQLLAHLANHGYPFAQVTQRDVVVRHDSQSMDVTFDLEPGTLARFGDVQIQGLQQVDLAVVRRHITWQRGELFQANQLEELRRQLVATGLFGLVQINPQPERAAPDNLLPIVITVTEAKPRVLSLQLGYDTYENFFVELQWEHRNLLGQGERLRLQSHLSGRIQELESALRLPAFHPNQEVQLRLSLATEELEAYTSRAAQLALLLDHQLTDTLRAGAGIAYKYSNIDQRGEQTQYNLISLPLQLVHDTGVPELNPVRGGRQSAHLTPFTSVSGTSATFLRSELNLVRYLPLRQTPQLTLAMRLNVASITGAAQDDIPADERLYAGGATSLRGYTYQTVGPLLDDDPVGGRSRLLWSVELRLVIRKNLSVVLFWDAGNVYRDTTPKWFRDAQHGAGVGLRYDTAIGPLRLDLAFPLNSRGDVDDPFHIYLSVGQAF